MTTECRPLETADAPLSAEGDGLTTLALRPGASASPAEPAFEIAVVAGPDAGKTFALDATSPARVLVGQSPACDVCLSDPSVSRRHVSLELTARGLRLTDLGSTNGTLVGDTTVMEIFLRGGETVQMGETTLRVAARTLSASAPSVGAPVVLASGDASHAVDSIDRLLAMNLQFGEARETMLDEFRRRYVERVLGEHQGNVVRAAAASGIGRRYFQRIKARQRNA